VVRHQLYASAAGRAVRYDEGQLQRRSPARVGVLTR